MLKLQHSADKEGTYRGFAPIEWSEALRCWCIFDPKLMVEILKSTDFTVVDSSEEYAKIEQRTGLSWTAAIDTLGHVPLAKNGERHAQLRRDFASLIGARSKSAKIIVGQLLAKAVPLVFRERRTAELVQDLLRPITDAMFGGLLGVHLKHASEDPSPSQIFDRSLGLNRRKIVQSEVAGMSKAFAEQAAELTTTPEYATALIVVGYDSLLGSLGASLVSLFEEGAGSRLSDLNYPDSFPRTGVPYIERVAGKGCTIAGLDVVPGDRIRLYLDACPARGNLHDEAIFFGKGRHLCLGKDLSQWLWRTLVQELGRIPLKVRVAEARLRSHDFAFNMYESITVSIDV